jgi:uncharacterized membrane protein (UPF0127 family)
MLLLVTGLGACDRVSATAPAGPKPTTLPTRKIEIAGRAFELELALDAASQQAGLMHRESMPADHGMLFVFPDEEEREFWMKNTRIPLDIIYLDSSGKVVSIRPMKPLDLTGVPSGRPAKYAIELNQGMAKAIGLEVGHTISIPAEIKPQTGN